MADSTLTRQALKQIAQSLGLARDAFALPLGDTDRHPGTLLELESALCRLRGSTLFHDTDAAKDFLHFGTDDPVGLGLSGARAEATTGTAASFPTIPNSSMIPWNPYYNGPPCLEGWAKWQYNAWAGHVISPLTNNAFEPVGGSPSELGYQRLTKNYPVRYASGVYERVPLWERCRWISFKNISISDGTTVSVSVTLTDDDLSGIHITDPATGTPVDVRAYGHPNLIQGRTGSNWMAITEPSSGDALTPLGVTISAAGEAAWQFTFCLPAAFNSITPWAEGTYWHIVLYWGSLDATAIAVNPSPENRSAASDDSYSTLLWPMKNFFRNEVVDRLTWDPRGIYDNSPRLVARHRTQFSYLDGQYSQPEIPVRYNVASWPAAPLGGISGSLAGYTEVASGEAVPVSITLALSGTGYDGAIAQPQFNFGPSLSPEFWSQDWSRCPYYPPLPDGQVLLARMILVHAHPSLYGLVEGNLFSFDSFTAENYDEDSESLISRLSILYFESVITTHAQAPLGDAELSVQLLGPLKALLDILRRPPVEETLAGAAFDLLVPGAQVNSDLASSRASLVDPTGLASTIFRLQLKEPFAAILVERPDDEPLAIQFASGARGVIEDLSGAPPSTEFMRLQADQLFLTNQALDSAQSFELYQEPIDNCSYIQASDSGTSIGNDYTLRLLLEDADQNILRKDWYVMASQYFLSASDYALLGSTTGYYTQSTLNTITEFRLYGYSGLVPDLQMGKSVPLLTRVVSPPDSTQQTQAQFIANLQAQNPNITQAQITEAILEYYEGGGEFYAVDLSQYPSLFTTVRQAAVAVTKYSLATEPYWQIDLDNYFLASTYSVPTSDVRYADSFTIAQNGLAVGVLEGFGNQATIAFSQTSETGTDSAFTADNLAIRIHLSAMQNITEIVLRLKNAPASGNTTGFLLNKIGQLNVGLYTDDGTTPGMPSVQLATGDSISFSTIATTYASIRSNISYTLSANTTYWIVLSKSTATIGGDLAIDSGTGGSGLRTQTGTADWVSDGTASAWLQLGNDAPVIVGAFNRETSNVLQTLPPANRCRTQSGNIVDGFWSYTCQSLGTLSEIAIYPRAINLSTDPSAPDWVYVPVKNNVYYVLHCNTPAGVVTVTGMLDSTNKSPMPVILMDSDSIPLQVSSIAYLAVGVTADELNPPFYGAPPGDRLVIRST